MEYETTDRGLKHFEPITTAYGHEIRVYESSAADSPHIWLDITQTTETAKAARSNIAPESATAHLSVLQALLLIESLTAAVRQHYHFANGKA